jgi:membrane protein YdbS with pleckstrin-like domain
MRPLGPAALRLRRIHALLVAAVVAVAGVALDLALRAGREVAFPVVVVPAAVAAVVGGVGWVAAGLVHRSWRWALEEDHLRVDRGVLVHRSALLPRRRVQHVSTRLGPLQRSVGVATLVVHTAGARTPNVVIEHLDQSVAEDLRAELARAAMAARAR